MPEQGNSNATQVQFDIAHAGKDVGTITIEVDHNNAPKSAENFLQYLDEGFFDGTIFHRVIPNFMIQGGGFISPTTPKRDGLRDPIENEAKNGLKNKRGTLAMARTADPHSATSQFFINVNDNDFLDYPGQDGWGYCVFGQVVDGMDVVDYMKSIDTQPSPQMGGENSQPVDPPIVKNAKRVG